MAQAPGWLREGVNERGAPSHLHPGQLVLIRTEVHQLPDFTSINTFFGGMGEKC